MSMQKNFNQQTGPKFTQDTCYKSRSDHNQSFDVSYSNNYTTSISNKSRNKSYSQQGNILDELEDEQLPNQINVTIQKRHFELALQNELQKFLSKIIAGQQFTIEDCQIIIKAIDECIQESFKTIKLKEVEITNIRKGYEFKINQYENTILSLENEIQELKHMITLNPNDSINFKLSQLEQENEMLKLQNEQAIKLAVQGRSKKQEKELQDATNSNKQKLKTQVNNYSILLNQQYNKIYQQDKKIKQQLF